MDQTVQAAIIRKTWGDNRWFPGDPSVLARDIESYLATAELPSVPGPIVAGIAPHAGYPYSGPVAGHTFRALRDQAAAGVAPDTVVILGFSHRETFTGLALMDGGALVSPLGTTALDVEAATWLSEASPRIDFNYRPHRGEHSAENEIPFVQAALPDARLVIGLFGGHDAVCIEAVAEALLGLAKRRRVVVIASTDLLHDASHGRVSDTDRETLKIIASLDRQGLADAWSPVFQVCCGIAPVLTVMRYAEAMGSRAGTVLAYSNSGDTHPESRGSWVVGYGALVFCGVPETEMA